MTRNYQALGLMAAAFLIGGLAALGLLPEAWSLGALPLVLGAVVQSTYSERMPAGAQGQIANMNTYTVDTFTVENSNGIGFGKAVGEGSADRGCRLGAAAAADFLGIAVRDDTLLGLTADSDYVGEYQQGTDCAVMHRGDMWVIPNGNVVNGDDVTFEATTGELSSTATGGTQFAITGAKWLDTASSGSLARVRLSGYAHSS